MTTQPALGSEEQPKLVVDVYGVRIHAPASDLGETPPRTWREVRTQVQGHLIRIAAAPTRLLVEVLEGATRLVRGISRVPASLATRIEDAHANADRLEHAREELCAISLDEKIKELEYILTKLRVNGCAAEIIIRDDGTPVVMIVGADERAAAAMLVEANAASLRSKD